MPHSCNKRKNDVSLTGRIIPGIPFSLRVRVGSQLLKIAASTVTNIPSTKFGDESGLKIAPQIRVRFRGVIAATKGPLKLRGFDRSRALRLNAPVANNAPFRTCVVSRLPAWSMIVLTVRCLAQHEYPYMKLLQ